LKEGDALKPYLIRRGKGRGRKYSLEKPFFSKHLSFEK
jgi:hypothetical protein